LQKDLLLKWNGRILSIKNAYALLLAEGSGCTFKQFRTFNYLVKLGFRVFRHNSELKNNNNSDKISNLTKLPITVIKKKICNENNIKLYCNSSFKNKVSFSEVKSTGWVVITKPPECYTPHNIQPNYDTYSFNITVRPDTLKITEMISFYETSDLKKRPFYHKPMVFNSKSIGMYPVYEKTTPKTIKSNKEDSYEPHVKRLKYSETVKDGLPIITNVTDSISSDISNSCMINNETRPMNEVYNALNNENNIIIEDSLTTIKNLTTSTLNDENVSKEDFNFTNKKLLDLKIEGSQQLNKKPMKNVFLNVNLSDAQNKVLDSKSYNIAELNNIPEDELCGMKLNLPSNNI